jgi:hypothetical protein
MSYAYLFKYIIIGDTGMKSYSALPYIHQASGSLVCSYSSQTNDSVQTTT